MSYQMVPVASLFGAEHYEYIAEGVFRRNTISKLSVIQPTGFIRVHSTIFFPFDLIYVH